MIAIFRGDDTSFAGANSVRVTIGTSVSLAGCRAEFNLCGVVKQIPDASTGTFTVAFTAEETAAMPLGVQCATVRVFDSQGRVRTASNTVRILVTDRVDEAYRYTNAADVTLASPGGIIDDGRGVPDDLPEEYTPDEMRAFLNRLAALIRNSMAALVALLMLPLAAQDWTNRVSTARFGAIRATSNVVTSVDLSGFITNAIQTESDPTVPSWAKAETPPASGLTTKDVCAVVTNETVTFSPWTLSANGTDFATGVIFDYSDEWGSWEMREIRFGDNQKCVFDETYVYSLKDATTFSAYGNIGEVGQDIEDMWWGTITATRKRFDKNALGLARLSDLPPLTNGMQDAIASSATASSNYTDAAIAAFTPTPAGRSWNRPGEWSLSYEPVLAEESSAFDSFTTNECGMVFSNAISRTVRGLSARVFPDALDPFTEAAPPPVVLSVPDGTVDGGVVSVPSNGIYRVKGTAASGEAREIAVPFASGVVSEKVASTYVADREGESRKLANDFSASALASMTDAGTAAYIGETNRFRLWRTIQPTFSWPGVGNTTPFAVAPRVMVTAAHYSDGLIWTGSITLTNWVDGGSFTVVRGAPVKLAEWAATNGFTAAEIAAAGDLSDIRMIPLTSGEVPANCCAWMASVEWMAEHYGDLRGMCAWAITQGSWWHPPGNAMQWAIPVVLRGGSLTAANTWMSAGGLKIGDIMPRADIAAMIGVYNVNEWYEIRGGDSGKPVWICDFTTGERRDILVSHFHTVGSGPNYAAALPLIRAYCAAHGTTIKEMQ